MIVRVRSRDGQRQVSGVNEGDDVGKLLVAACSAFGFDPAGVVLANNPAATRPFPASGRSLAQLGIRHGDLLYLAYPATVSTKTTTTATATTTATTTATAQDHPVIAASLSASVAITQLPVDDELDKKEGLIKRSRDANFCRHGPNAMCDYCMPLEPYDKKYLEQNKIKHLSFHAYLRQLRAQNKNAASSHIPALDEPSLKVNPVCPSSHPPYPQSMCAKCQPSAVVLQQQSFRMVDHVEFEAASIVDNFIAFWRQTGLQRFGWLYGRYERYDVVPLGIKAVVSAIYEPPQANTVDGVELHQDTVAAKLGLLRVGVIYTDLLDDGTGRGKVQCRRYADTFFLSSSEVVFVANIQSKYPNPCKYASNGNFGSKFVSVVISGDKENNIQLSSYQISNMGVAMVRDNIIDASTEPNLLLVQPSTPEHYVPEVFYKYRNKYNVLVQEAAKPTFPVEYLLLTDGFPQTQNPLFIANETFPIENRTALAHQDLSVALAYIEKCGNVEKALSNFHFLLFLQSTHIFDEKDFTTLLELIKNKTPGTATMLESMPSWKTLTALLREHGASASSASTGQGSGGSTATSSWSCRHCTYNNTGNRPDCDMCGLPKA